jgi:hypothetical protein
MFTGPVVPARPAGQQQLAGRPNMGKKNRAK